MSVNKVSFDFERIYGISLVPLVPRDPRCEWSRWRSFSLCFAGVLRSPPPNPPYQPLGWSYGSRHMPYGVRFGPPSHIYIERYMSQDVNAMEDTCHKMWMP